MQYIHHISKIMVLVSIACLCALASAQSPSPSPVKDAAASDVDINKDTRFVFEFGGQYRDVSGERPSKFEEYKSIRKGAIARRGAVEFNPEGSPNFFTFTMRNASERDQQFSLDGGKYGRFRTSFSWWSQPHLFTRGATTLFTMTSPGVYTVPDGIQSNLQALDPPPTGSTTTPNPALIAAVRSSLATGSTIDVRSRRESFTFTQRVNLTDNWSLRFRFNQTRRTGQRPLGTGTYERTGTTAGDTFRTHMVELPAEIDQRTENITFGASYLTARWGVNFDFIFSKFTNNIDSYTYDNPFRLTDQATTGTNGAFNRQAFARGLHSTMPDNESRGFMITAFADLPHDSRWAGAFGWERWTQDQQFLPWTLNSTVTATGLTPTSTASLPQQSLEGEFENVTVDQLFTTRAWKNLTLNLHYRAYHENNKTEEILFPGYAAFLEAYWRPTISGSFGVRLIENEPASYLRQRASGEAVWDITRKVRWRGEYEWEGWNRQFRQVGRTNEHKFGTFLSIKPNNTFKADLDYRYQKRTPQSYVVGPLENRQLRMFDQSERRRNDLRFKWQWAASAKVGFSGDFAYLNDDYDKDFFGLTEFTEYRAGADLLYNVKENTTFYLNYAREHYKSSLQSISKTGVPFDLNNRWDRSDRNVNDNFGVGVTTYLNNSKWFVDVNYAINYGRGLITTTNPATPVASALNNATAFPFPESRSRYQEFSVDTNYQIHSKAALGIRYYFEPFMLDDWQTNGLSSYPVDTLAPETDGRRFLLLDSRYSSHHGHIFSVYIRFGN